MKKYILEYIGAMIGFFTPAVNKIISNSWWDDWFQPVVLSIICAVLGAIAIHYTKKALNSFDNWIANLKLRGK